MADMLDILGKEQKSETKQIKIIKSSEDYSESYKKVFFEEHAPRQKNKNELLFNFQDSLDNLMQRGYARHPRPNEVFSLLCSYLEGDLSVKDVAEDMLSGYGEWFSLAMKHQSNLLHCYIDPDFEYDKKQMLYNLKSCSSEKLFSFPSSDKYSFNIKEINALNPSVVEFLWSRPFDELPLKIRNKACLYLSTDEHVWPAGRSSDYYKYVVCYITGDWPSRGVRVIGEKNCLDGKSFGK